MNTHLININSFRRICYKYFWNEILRFIWNILPLSRFCWILTRFYRFIKRQFLTIKKRGRPRKKYKNYYSNAPIVAFFPIFFLLKYFRSNVPRSTACRASQWILWNKSCQSKISNLKRSQPVFFLFQKYILWFYISMKNFLLMAIPNSVNQYFSGFPYFIFWELSFFINKIEQISSLH